MDDKKINEMNDLDIHHQVHRMTWEPHGRRKIRIGLPIDMGVIVAVNAISRRVGKVALG